MDKDRAKLTVIVAEDDSDDRMMIEEAFELCELCNLEFVEDGEALLDYLRRERDEGFGRLSEERRVVLLDLNMPRMNGQEALKEIKSDPELSRIPVVVFTTSSAEEDIVRSYDLGVNSFITKPVTFDQVIGALHSYWGKVVTLPN